MSTHSPTLTERGVEILDKLLQGAHAKGSLPATFFLVTNAEGEIYSEQVGDKVCGDETQGRVNEDTVMELWSQTKLITSVAALKLVDAGLISLDDSKDVERYLPEIASLKVLARSQDDSPELVDKDRAITLRMLLTHSAGLAEAHPLLTEWEKQHPSNSLPPWHPSATIDSLVKPLVYQPGTSWLYSPSVDAVGKLIERVSEKRLDKYLQDEIFSSLGISSMSFFPTDHLKENKMAVCVRSEDGSLKVPPGGVAYGRSMKISDIPTGLLSGGSGLFGTQSDYLTVLRAILRSDPGYTGQPDAPRLLSAESFRELFSGCIPLENRTALARHVDPVLGRAHSDHSVGFSVSLVDLPGRRRAGSGYWAGVAKTMFWVDPTTGIAGICATQLISPGDKDWFALFKEFEETVYAHLEPDTE